MDILFDEAYHHSCNVLRVHGLKSANTHWDEGLELITVIGGVHHVETVR